MVLPDIELVPVVTGLQMVTAAHCTRKHPFIIPNPLRRKAFRILFFSPILFSLPGPPGQPIISMRTGVRSTDSFQPVA
jgi:hypothetical protein